MKNDPCNLMQVLSLWYDICNWQTYITQLRTCLILFFCTTYEAYMFCFWFFSLVFRVFFVGVVVASAI
jgi:hypothetical protein